MAMADTPPITDENLRMSALQAIFPGMQISLVSGKRIGEPSPKKRGTYELDGEDALAKDNVYRVVGKATNEAEGCASEDMSTPGKFVDVRLVRFRLFHWPANSDLLAVLQYNFEGASPAGSCWSVGLLARLAEADGRLKVQEQHSLNAHHQSTLLSIRMLDFTGDGIDELVVEPDFGGAGTWGSSLQIFDLSRSRFEPVLDTISRISYMTDEMYLQVLDISKTIKQRGAQFCFIKTTIFEGGKPAIPNRRTHPCYQRGEGVNFNEAEERNKMLSPFPKP
jgi:hypothetical protein